MHDSFNDIVTNLLVNDRTVVTCSDVDAEISEQYQNTGILDYQQGHDQKRKGDVTINLIQHIRVQLLILYLQRNLVVRYRHYLGTVLDAGTDLYFML